MQVVLKSNDSRSLARLAVRDMQVTALCYSASFLLSNPIPAKRNHADNCPALKKKRSLGTKEMDSVLSVSEKMEALASSSGSNRVSIGAG